MQAIVINAALDTAGKAIDLGTDPAYYLEKLTDWRVQTNLTLDTVGVPNDNQKLNLILLWGGKN